MIKYICEWDYTFEAKNKDGAVYLQWDGKERGILTMEEILASKLKLTILGAVEE